jgi:NADPH:quinone reductase
MTRLATVSETTSMKAAYFETTGGPEVLQYGELPTPSPKPGEVRVRVVAASVNPIDVYFRSGMVKANLPLPFIPGCDLAGTVDAIGEGVTTVRVGERVWGSNQGLLGRQGTSAEFACVEERWLYPTPANVSDDDAAAVSLVGITAHLGLFHRTNLQANETVFVNGGTGGVGSMVVQLAKVHGANVITTVGSDEKAKVARELGADVVINYKNENLAEAVKRATEGRGVNVWYETQPPAEFEATIELMAPRGRIVVMAGRNARPTLPNGAFYVKGLQLIGFAMFNMTADEQRVCANELNQLLAANRIRALIGTVFPLSATAEAHRLQERNTLGKAGTLVGKILVKPQ